MTITSQQRNLAAAFDPGQVRAYDSAEQHLRDELWRVWLRIEREIRRRWELQALPNAQLEGSIGRWEPREIEGLFRGAHTEYTGAESLAADLGATEIADTEKRHSALVELRIERTLAAGRELPLLQLVRMFKLDPRQRATLTLVLAAELDIGVSVALRYLANDPGLRLVDGRLLSMLVYDSVRARSRLARDLSARSPLMFYRLLELDENAANRQSVMHRRLRVASRLIPYLEGGDRELDPELDGIAQLIALHEPGLFADELVDTCATALRDEPVMLVLQGQRGIGKRTLLATAGLRWGRKVLALDCLALARLKEPQPVLHAIVRELEMLDAIPALIDLDDVPQQGSSYDVPGFVAMLAAMWHGPIAITLQGERLPPIRTRPVVHVAVPLPSLDMRIQLWARAERTIDPAVASELSERFAVTGGVIDMASRAARASTGEVSLGALDLAVRNQLYGRLQRLGRSLPTPHTLDDVVADADSKAMLGEVISAIRERRRVRQEWGFHGAAGISVLFSGSPGVGKSMSATVIAHELGLAIYEIDLSQVMSKWIGETEKNLAEIFDAAEPGHVVLLFNEADALFGKRTAETHSSNDRHSNLEVGYLLQRLERFGGLSILTTNLTKSIDPAFRRRFAYDVQFAFPTVDLRAELWKRAFPRRALTADLDHKKLAERFEMSGGYIKVAAERAAFIAAGRQEAISMEILTQTIERMYRERGKLSAVGKLE